MCVCVCVCVCSLTPVDKLVDVRVQALEVALPPQAGVCGEQRPAALGLQDAHPQDGPPVLQQLLLLAADMNGLHQRHIPMSSPAAARVHQRQVVDGHFPVLLVVGVGSVSVAVVFVSAGVGLIPVVGGDGGDQQQQGQHAERKAHRRHRHRHRPGSFHGRDMERAAPGPGAGSGAGVRLVSAAVSVIGHFLLPSLRLSAVARLLSRARCHADWQTVRAASRWQEVTRSSAGSSLSQPSK